MNDSPNDAARQDASSLEDSIKRGTTAVVAAQIASQIVSFAALAYLYRRLGPEPFGLIGMAMPALLLTRMLAGFGWQESVIQATTLEAETRDRVFWMSQLSGLVAGALMVGCGPLLAWLFQSPRLIAVCAGLAVTLPLTTLAAVHQGWWQRQLAIAALMKVRLLAQAVAAVVACVLAWRGVGVWALVGQQIAELGLLAAIIWWASDWRPRWRGRLWDSESFRFGGWYTGASFGFYWTQNVDKLVLAWLMGSSPIGRAAIGMYHQAYNLALKPVSLVTSPASGIVLPALARLQDQPVRFARLVRTVWWLLAALLVPAAAGIALVAPDVIRLLGGTRWFSAGALLVALSPLVFAQGLINICGSVFASRGEARALCWGAVAQAVVLSLTGAMVAAVAMNNQWTPHQSIRAMALAVGATTALLVLSPYLIYCARVTHVALKPLAAPLLHIAAATVLMGIMVRAARGLLTPEVDSFQRLVWSVAVGGGTYVFAMRHALVRAWNAWRSDGEI